MDTIVVSFARHGPFLGTRRVGENVRNEILKSVDLGNSVILDFSQVEGVSQSFADECIGKLLIHMGSSEFRGRVRFRSVSSGIKPILNHVLSQRAESLNSESRERQSGLKTLM